jgi:glutathione S-transferase
MAEMITVFGGGASRSLRVTWLMEEMGIAYRLRYVDLLSNPEEPEFLAVNPGGFIPVMLDGEATMVESIAIMEYLMARYGPTTLALDPRDARLPGLPADSTPRRSRAGRLRLLRPRRATVRARGRAGQLERRPAQEVFDSRLRLVTRQLARSPYLAGEAFTAADISVTYALLLATRYGGVTLGAAEQAYMDRVTSRDAFKRALEKSQAATA